MQISDIEKAFFRQLRKKFSDTSFLDENSDLTNELVEELAAYVLDTSQDQRELGLGLLRTFHWKPISFIQYILVGWVDSL